MNENQNNTQCVSYDWDSTFQNEEKTFTLLPDGDYSFVVTGFERGSFEGSEKMPACPMAILTMDVTNGTDSGTIQDRLFLNSRSEWRICQFFTAIGQRRHGEAIKPNWSKVQGSRGTLKLEISKFTKRDGTQGENNKVKQYYEKQSAPAAQASFTPGNF